MRFTTTLATVSLFSLPLSGAAQDANAGAAPVRPMQPAWPDEWSNGYKPASNDALAGDPESGETSAPAAATAEAGTAQPQVAVVRRAARPKLPGPSGGKSQRTAGRSNELFLFDAQGRRVADATAQPETLATPVVVGEARAESAPARDAPAERPAPVPNRLAPPDLDLRAPHVWMGTGAVLVGVSLLAGLAAGIVMDEPELMVTAAGLGGTLGIGALTVGVVMQNRRYAEVGYQTTPALPRGIELQLKLTLP